MAQIRGDGSGGDNFEAAHAAALGDRILMGMEHVTAGEGIANLQDASLGHPQRHHVGDRAASRFATGVDDAELVGMEMEGERHALSA